VTMLAGGAERVCSLSNNIPTRQTMWSRCTCILESVATSHSFPQWLM